MRRGDWALLDRKVIHDIENREDTYLDRLYIVETPWFGVFLHAIYRHDHERALHDHPWTFWSLILKGGYSEDVAIPTTPHSPILAYPRIRAHRAGSFHRFDLWRAHAIRLLFRVPTWTLVIVGPRRRDWGYWTPNGWVESHEYHRSLGLTEADSDF